MTAVAYSALISAKITILFSSISKSSLKIVRLGFTFAPLDLKRHCLLKGVLFLVNKNNRPSLQYELKKIEFVTQQLNM